MLHIDPPQRRLMVRGPIEQPLIFTIPKIESTSICINQNGSNFNELLGLLRRLVLGFLLERFPDGFVTDEALFAWRLLPRCIKTRLTVGHFGGWFLLAHRSSFFP